MAVDRLSSYCDLEEFMSGMSTLCQRATVGSLLLLSTLVPAGAEDRAGFSLGTAFNYQGRLQHDGRAAQGRFDFAFELFDAAQGGRSFGRVDRLDLPVSQGAFVVELDFGPAGSSGDPGWLEIQVRPAGEGAFTALEPRQRLAEGRGALCTVDSDVLINGTLGVGVASVSAPLHLPGIPDAEPGSGGVLVVGAVTGSNVAIDANEIMARFNGQPSTLLLNNDGGTVVVGGPLDIGYQIVEQTFGATPGQVSCPAGLRVLGGGCRSWDTPPDPLFASQPFNFGADYGWFCAYHDQDSDSSEVVAYAVCANVQ